MRNNEDRMGISDRNTGAEAPSTTVTAPTTQAPPANPQMPPQQAHQSANPLLNFVSPTEFVELPSKGKFYSEAHPLYNVDVVEIKHMTAREEDILTSEALLKKGIALDRFIQQILIDKRINPDTLLIGDKNAILVAARISGYGPGYETSVTCPSCQTLTKHRFDLNEVASVVVDIEPDDTGVSVTNNGTFIIKELPITGWAVEVRPLTGEDEKRINKSIEAKRNKNLSEDILTTQMSTYVVSISGVTDRTHISEAISSMPAMDSKFLRIAYEKIIPNLDMSHTFTCSECDHSGTVEVPFTTDFFWPK